MKKLSPTKVDPQSPQNQRFESVFTHLEQDLSTLQKAHNLLKDLSCFQNTPELETHLNKTRTLLEEAKAQQAPLKLLLLGGTGVGKSSLINHLADQFISSTSHSVRAHTRGFVVYLHASWKERATPYELNKIWPTELQKLSSFSYHQIESLRSLWLIDAPDTDSIVNEHPQRVEKALFEVDLPMWVSSPQNYRDHINIEFLKLIDPKRPLLAIINQVDRLTKEEQSEVLSDAQEFIDDLGFRDSQWFTTACLDPKLSQLSSSPDRSKQIAKTEADNKELRRLKSYLGQHFDRKEQAHLKRLRLIQRLQESCEILHKPLKTIELIKAKQQSFDEMHSQLTPVFRMAVSLGLQKQLNQKLQTLYSQKYSSQQEHYSLLIAKKLWSCYSSFIQFFPKSLATEYHEATAKLQVEELKLYSNLNSDSVGSKHVLNDSDCSLREVVLQTIECFGPAFDSLQQKLRQAAQKSFMSSLIKQLLTSLILVALAFYFFHDPSLDHDHELITGFTASLAVLFASLLFTFNSIIIAFQGLKLSVYMQQECLIFINQRQHEITSQSQKALHDFLQQDPSFATQVSKHKTSMQADTQNMSTRSGIHGQINNKLDYQSELQRELEQSQLMLKIYKESLHSLQKYSSTLSTIN